MRRIGLVGGISWVSTLEYYKRINEGVNQKLGGLQSAECLIDSINFGELQQAGWDNGFPLLHRSCMDLKKGGAEAIALCANTAHLYVDRLAESVNLPFINIVEETANVINNLGMKSVGLIGTKFTMESGLYSEYLQRKNITCTIPETQNSRDYIQQTLKEELGIGLVRPETREAYLKVANDLIASGAEGIVLGCTELPLIFNQITLPVTVFDTLEIHCQAIVRYMTE